MIGSFHRGKFSLAGALLMAALLLAWPRSAAADDPAGISVTGAGQATTRPSAVEIDATVSGEAELAADATVKYRDTKKKAVAALDGLKIPGLTVESEGQQLSQAVDPNNQMRMMQGMQADNGKSKVMVSESIKVLIKLSDATDPDKVMATALKVVDAARDSGLVIGPAPPSNYIEAEIRARGGGSSDLVTFVIPDVTDLRDQAYERAMADARTKAERLAKLSGVKLGPVLSVEEQKDAHPADSGASLMMMMYGIGSQQQKTDDDNAVHSSALHDIPVAVHLSVRFAILPDDGK